ncbi:hypothetical protein P7C73_g6744, partial [Tremellales sp. Uapishka_1]
MQADMDAQMEILPEERIKLEMGKGDKDKDKEDAAVATSPSESMSSLESEHGAGMQIPAGNERDQNRAFRERAWSRGEVDLAKIARTSTGIAQSPPNASILATSPKQGRK